MPIFEYQCKNCDKVSEIIVFGDDDTPACGFCNSHNLEKLLSAPSASGPVKNRMPGPGDTACCGSSPGQASCAGPGSCCGRNMD